MHGGNITEHYVALSKYVRACWRRIIPASIRIAIMWADFPSGLARLLIWVPSPLPNLVIFFPSLELRMRVGTQPGELTRWGFLTSQTTKLLSQIKSHVGIWEGEQFPLRHFSHWDTVLYHMLVGCLTHFARILAVFAVVVSTNRLKFCHLVYSKLQRKKNLSSDK